MGGYKRIFEVADSTDLARRLAWLSGVNISAGAGAALGSHPAPAAIAGAAVASCAPVSLCIERHVDRDQLDHLRTVEAVEREQLKMFGAGVRQLRGRTMIECAYASRLGRDAELRMVRNGELPLLSFTCAVERRVQTDDAPSTWVDVAVFGDRAEQLAASAGEIEGRTAKASRPASTAAVARPLSGARPRGIAVDALTSLAKE
jgi:hypothetical protein